MLALAWRDIRLRYSQTALGVTWVLLQPLLGSFIFTLVFSLIARVRDTVLIGTACPELNGTDDLGVIIIGPESETIANDWRDYVEEYQASGNKLGDPDNGPSELGAMLDQFAGKHN